MESWTAELEEIVELGPWPIVLFVERLVIRLLCDATRLTCAGKRATAGAPHGAASVFPSALRTARSKNATLSPFFQPCNGPFTHFYHGKASPYSVVKEDVQLEENQQYEPGWGHNSGNSYNNGPFTHFYYGKASPYPVTNENVQVDEKYEPGWCHNSGNSYNNGPFTHFYYGKASPYPVTNENVQLDEKAEYEPLWGHNSGNSYNNGPFTHFYYGKASPYAVTKDD